MSGNVNLKDPRIVRIFLSSPFRGMEAERECLTSVYWPRLRSALLSKGLLLRVVDMRWGITTEMSSDHQTINICLREIDRSDVFIGLYAQRYGWHGEGDGELQMNFDTARKVYPWVDMYRDRSVTELEFLHGHLNNPGDTAACFAFRNTAYDERERERAKSRGDQKGELSHSPDNGERLNDLKRRVAESEKDTLGVVMDYDSPEQCAEFVYNCVKEYINKEILVKMAHSLSIYEISQFSHDAYLKRRTGKYISGRPYYEALNRYVDQAGEMSPVVVTGPTGSEKASLLASWLQERKAREGNADIVISHFLNAEPKACSPAHLLMRLIGNLEEKVMGRKPSVHGGETDTSELLAKLDDLFVEVQEEKHRNKKVIIICDMVEQLLPEKSNSPLFMIPRTLPGNVRIVLTVILGSAASKQTLRILEEDYNSPVIYIKPLTEEVKRGLCTILLDQHSKSMSPEQVDMIVKSEKTSNPFFLHNLILELCISGRFRELNKQIETFLKCEDVVELLCHILRRIEEEYSHPDYEGNLVKDVLCAICLCNRGIAEGEFPMPERMWIQIIYALRDHIIDRSGLLGFAFPEMKEAVGRLYMPDSESRQAAARKVCDIFYSQFKECISKKLPLPRRVALELPHLIHEINDPVQLKRVISNITVFNVLSKAAPHELLEHWQVLGCTGQVVARAYLASLDNDCAEQYTTHLKNLNTEGMVELVSWKAEVLRDIRLWMEQYKFKDGIELVFDKEILVLSRMAGKPTLECSRRRCKTRLEKATFLMASGRYQEALALHNDVLIVRKMLLDRRALQGRDLYESYYALGRCCYKLRRLEEAERWYKLALEVSPGQKEDLAWVYHSLGVTYHHQGNQSAAMEYLEKSVSLWESMYRLSAGLAITCLKLGTVYQKQGDLTTAEKRYKRSLKLNESLFGQNSVGVADALTNLSLLEEQKKDHWRSLRLITKSLKIFKRKEPEHKMVHVAAETKARQIKELNIKPDAPEIDDIEIEI